MLDNSAPTELKHRLKLSTAALLLNFCPQIFAVEVNDMSRMDLEQLMTVELETVTASKYNQKLSETASSVTVVGKDQIQQFGYRTLSDVLRTVPGFFITNNREYDNAGIRGFDQSADYNGRMLVMIDGIRMNEAIYDSGFTDNALPIDMDLVERVEIVRGPGSSLYGNNAFFAVVNVITKLGKDYQGGELGGSWSSFDSYKGRASYGRKLDNGLDFLASASGFNSAGQSLQIPEAASPSNPLGASSGANNEHDKQFFAKANWGNFSFEGGYGRRFKGIPGGIFGVDLGPPASSLQDSEAFVNLQYQKALSPKLDFTARTFYGDYDYKGQFRYGGLLVNNLTHAWWTGLEMRLLSSHFDGHKILVGAEAQENWQLQQYADIGPPISVSQDDSRDTHRIGIFVQDDVDLTERLKLSLGARFDDNSLSSQSMFSPRVGLVYQALADTVLKLQYGKAFRSPTIAQQFYTVYGIPNQTANTGLQPEQIDTVSLTWEQAFAGDWHFTATGYYLKQNKRLGVEEIAGFSHAVNLSGDVGYGGEFELQRRWDNGALLRTGYSLIFAEDQDPVGSAPGILGNVPRHLYQLNFMTPLFSPKWRGGFDMQVLSSRMGLQSNTPGYTRVGLNLLYQPITYLDLSAGVYDLLDDNRLEPGGIYGIPQEGRTFRLKFQCRF
ncbi:TonB-dependent receptor plug domain-containing protein [Candidatus Methylobacter oryzae]|uniref:TonB-dependent receptor n=1 Tax=Candidatus Methylobacter oryzae TaxID=2497749 RepID=A0ABY3CB40_9GAMM|nr:TonB-dependent receptor [Candidatus Methylobacter oryzae]TRW95024.1 TonB-dependent receptor [Candidatus Methylobacter oryzae]